MKTVLQMESLGARITKAASRQSYYTVRFLVDRELVTEAYQAYAYFRWVDDWLDEPTRERSDRLAFVRRQSALIDACYRHKAIQTATAEESMLAALVQKDAGKNSGLQAYIRNMMAVMTFDAERRGRLISHDELNRYALGLATAVTEALHYFIGHGARLLTMPRVISPRKAHILRTCCAIRSTMLRLDISTYRVNTSRQTTFRLWTWKAAPTGPGSGAELN